MENPGLAIAMVSAAILAVCFVAMLIIAVFEEFKP